jgi:hypothetical protein
VIGYNLVDFGIVVEFVAENVVEECVVLGFGIVAGNYLGLHL